MAKLDRNGYAPSIIAVSDDFCWFCGRSDQKLDRHEIYGGPYRSKSKKYGLWVPLCHQRCHLNGVHRIALANRIVRQKAQKMAMETYGWTKEQFISEFGKNYLEE